MGKLYLLINLILLQGNCHGRPSSYRDADAQKALTPNKVEQNAPYDTAVETIHILVALCDNKYQGIVPVPAKIGNGQNPNANLYWGCGYGIRSYFKKSSEWKFLKSIKIDSVKMERVLFKHVSKNIYLIADAYNGMHIKQCTVDFLNSCSGKLKDTMHVGKQVIGINGHSKLLSYIGHDGLMDFELPDTFKNEDGQKRDCIILACISKSYFSSFISQTGSNPIVWTTGLMCPEAYTVHDAITGFANRESSEQIRTRAAMAYAKYQKCGLKAARRLLVTGF
jgi:hypothetical protein